jgi:hypothetical protein
MLAPAAPEGVTAQDRLNRFRKSLEARAADAGASASLAPEGKRLHLWTGSLGTA